MSSIRQFRNLASQLFKVTLAAQRNDTQETNKQVDGMLDCIAEMLEDMDKSRPTLTTVADHAMSEMAFGRPMFVMDPYNDPYQDGGAHEGAHDGAHEGEPRLVIHDPPVHESPTIKVTKIGGDSNLPSVPSLPSLPSVKQDASGTTLGTTLESLFLGVSPYQDDPYYEGPSQDGMDGMDYVDHESIRSDDVGIDVRDSDEEDGEDGFEEPKVPFEYEGKQYTRGLLSQRVFDTNGSDETCVGVWVNETFVPLLKTLASQQKKDE